MGRLVDDLCRNCAELVGKLGTRVGINSEQGPGDRADVGKRCQQMWIAIRSRFAHRMGARFPELRHIFIGNI